jgi:hypothetical protein
VYGILSGFKEEVISTFLYVGIPYYFGMKKIPYLKMSVLLVAFTILYPINNTYRDIINSTNVDKIDAIGIAIISTFDENISNVIQSGSDNYNSRLSLFPMAMYGVQIAPDWNEYRDMQRYMYLPLSWIVPRIILPNKPSSDIGNELYRIITGRTNSSVTPSTYIWAYLEGGFIYVFLVFMILGSALGILSRVLKLSTLYGMIMYVILFPVIIKNEADAYFLISTTLQAAVIVLVYLVVFTKKAESSNNVSLRT